MNKNKEVINRSYDAKMLMTREAEANDLEDDENSSANQNMTALNTRSQMKNSSE